jgi:hypothetical protein
MPYAARAAIAMTQKCNFKSNSYVNQYGTRRCGQFAFSTFMVTAFPETTSNHLSPSLCSEIAEEMVHELELWKFSSAEDFKNLGESIYNWAKTAPITCWVRPSWKKSQFLDFTPIKQKQQEATKRV